MKQIILSLFLLLLSGNPLRAQELSPDAKTRSELFALRERLFDAMSHGDRAALERILADGFVFVHSTGKVENKPEFIAHTVAQPPAARVEFLEDDLRLYDGATVIWITRSRRPFANGMLYFRGTDVLVRHQGRWQWASVQSTRLQGP